MARPSSSSSARSSGVEAANKQSESANGTASIRPVTKLEDNSGDEKDEPETHRPVRKSTSGPLPTDRNLYPNGERSLSSISWQAFYLGVIFAASLILGIQAATYGYKLWRLSAFIGCLSLFHFLEFWTYAAYNTPNVRASSFLLFSNGVSYNTAHTCAALEILISNFFFTGYQQVLCNPLTVALGLFLVILGQATRSSAIATAGSNFNHIPQRTKHATHELVTSGVYNWSRHPSYFGFFWWALGTQLLVGNKICLLAYTVALWKFFSDRIRSK